jgi:hypothetical protein
MNRTEILELARSASEGDRQALARFRKLALAAGFVGHHGGWIYGSRADGARPVCQGWAALASKARAAGPVLDKLVGTEEATVPPVELDRSAAGTLPCVVTAGPGSRTTHKHLLATGPECNSAWTPPLAAVAEGIAAQGELPGMWDAADLYGGEADMEDAQKDLGAGPYAIEVLTPVSGVARVAVLAGEDKRVQVFHGDTALQDAVSAMIQYNAGTATPPEPVEPRVHPGDVVTIHRGLRRYEVLRVELDSFQNGERCDYARVVPCAPEDDRDAQWVAMDLLHVVEPVATLSVVEVNGFMVTEELVDLGHHTVTETEAKRVALIPDPAMGGAKTRLVLVDPRFPRGAMPGAEETAERPVMYPGDSVILHRPSGNTVARWMPGLDPTEASNVLQDVTWVSRTHATS